MPLQRFRDSITLIFSFVIIIIIIVSQAANAAAAELYVTDKNDRAAIDVARRATYRLLAKPAHTDLQPLQPNSNTQLWSAV